MTIGYIGKLTTYVVHFDYILEVGICRGEYVGCVTTNFMVQNGTEWYRMVHEWYQYGPKYGTSMVHSQNMVQIMVQYGTIMGEIWGNSCSPNFVHNCTIILYHNSTKFSP